MFIILKHKLIKLDKADYNFLLLQLFPEWGYLKESVLDFARFVFDFDSLVSSHPVSKEIGHPNEISQIFDTISYKKGNCIFIQQFIIIM